MWPELRLDRRFQGTAHTSDWLGEHTDAILGNSVTCPRAGRAAWLRGDAVYRRFVAKNDLQPRILLTVSATTTARSSSGNYRAAKLLWSGDDAHVEVGLPLAGERELGQVFSRRRRALGMPRRCRARELHSRGEPVCRRQRGQSGGAVR